MTLLEMSRQYEDDARVFAGRIAQLQRLADAETDPEAHRQLHRRMVELAPLLRQSRVLAQITAHYYDKEDHKHAQYRL